MNTMRFARRFNLIGILLVALLLLYMAWKQGVAKGIINF